MSKEYQTAEELESIFNEKEKESELTSYIGFVNEEVGHQNETSFFRHHVTFELEKIPENPDVRTPDFVCPENGHVFEVRSTSIFKKNPIARCLKNMGLPMNIARTSKHNLRKCIKEALKHAKEKNLDYVRELYGLKDVVYYCIHYLNFEWTEFCSVFPEKDQLVAEYSLDDYHVDAYVIIFPPSQLKEEKPDLYRTVVYYEKEMIINTSCIKAAKYIDLNQIRLMSVDKR